jgi:hypothetical protein
MADAQYTFDTVPNSYFRGTDLRVTDGTEHTIIVNEKDGMLGVNVKDEQTVQSFPADVMEAWNRLPEQRRQQVYEGVLEEYWRWVADLAETYDFKGVSQEGRGGGWLCVVGLNIDGGDLIEPDDEARDERDRFLAFAFEAERAIEDDWRGQLYDAFKAAVGKSDETLITVKFSEEDVRGMARDTEVDPERAVARMHEWAKAIGDRLVELGNEQLYEFCISALATEAAERTREGEEPYWTRFCPECHVMVEPEGEEELTCSNGHTFKRTEAFAVVWGEEIPFDQPELWTEFDIEGFTADPHTEALPEGTERLDRLSDGDRFEDAAGKRFWKALDGPSQGAVVITDGDKYQTWDCGLMVRPLNAKEAV